MNKRIIIVSIIIASAVFLTWWYLNLGGLKDIKFKIEDRDYISVFGEYYEGKYNSQEVENLFIKARDIASSSEKVELAVVNYGDDSKARQIKQFIGITGDNAVKLSAGKGYEERVFGDRKYITAVLNLHNSVMPNPEKVREDALNFADSLNLNIEDFSIELYKEESELTVLFPVKK